MSFPFLKLIFYIYLSSYNPSDTLKHEQLHYAASQGDLFGGVQTPGNIPQTSVCRAFEKSPPRLVVASEAFRDNARSKVWKFFADIQDITSSVHSASETCQHTFQDVSAQSTINGSKLWIQTSTPVLHLIDGSTVLGEYIRDVDHLVTLLPLVLEVNSVGLIDWLESMSSDMRQVVLSTLLGQSFVGGGVDGVEQLYHFQTAQKAVAQMTSTMNAVEDGNFVELIDGMTEETVEQYSFSFAIMRKGIDNYLKKIEENIKNGTRLPDQPAKVGGYDVAGFMVNLPNYAFDMYFAIDDKDWMALGTVVAFLLVDIGSTFAQKLLGSSIGLAFSFYNGFTNLIDLVKNIEKLVEGALSGLELAIVILDVLSNIVAIIGTVVAVVLAVLDGGAATSFIVNAIVVVIELLLNIAKLIVSLLYASQINRKIQATLDSFEYDLPLTPEERTRMEQQIKDGEMADQYLIDLRKQRLLNDELVDAQLKALAESPNLLRSVFPSYSGSGSTDFYENSVVDLSKKQTYMLDRAAPKLGYRFTCSPVKFGHYIVGAPAGTGGDQLVNGYPCTRAIAIEYRSNRVKDPVTLVGLMNGEDTAVGATDTVNIFVVEDGKKTFTGGPESDVFVLNGTTFSGVLNGGNGNDTITINSKSSMGGSVIVNFEAQRLTYRGSSFTLQSVEIFVGRAGEREDITTACNTLAVLGKGGSSQERDIINIPHSRNCPIGTNLYVELTGSALVKSGMETLNGTVVYDVKAEQHAVELDIQPFWDSVTHYIKLNVRYDDYTDIWTDGSNSNRRLLVLSRYGNVTTRLAPLKSGEGFHSQPLIQSEDKDISISVSDVGKVTVSYYITRPHSSISAKNFGDWVFHIDSSAQSVIGGMGNAIFVLKSDLFRGALVGGTASHDHLLVEDSYQRSSTLSINMVNGRTSNGAGTALFTFIGITQVTGRPGISDNIFPNCETKFVNTRRGSSDATPNVVDIANSPCRYECTIRLDENSVLRNNADHGNFTYILPLQNNMDVTVRYGVNVTHTFVLEFGAREIVNGTLLSNTIAMIFGSNDRELRIPLYKPAENDVVETGKKYFEPTIVTNETGMLMVSYDGQYEIIFTISEDREDIIGSPFTHNIFMLNASLGHGVGGDNEDIFLLSKTGFEGILNGSLGRDTLVVTEEYYAGSTAVVDLTNSAIVNEIKFFNIEDVIGRKGQSDIITAHCDIKTIDGNIGVSWDDPDVIVFPRESCVYDVRLALRKHTVVENKALYGDFLYTLEERSGHFDVLTPVRTLNHTMILNFTQSAIANITFDVDVLHLQFDQVNGDILTVQFQSLEPNGTYYPQPLTLSQDIIAFKINDDNEVIGFFEVNGNLTDGFPFIRNTFIINHSEAVVTGGDFVDTFLFRFANKTATVFGGFSDNILIVDGTEKLARVNIVANDYLVAIGEEDIDTPNIIYTDISLILGRENQSDTAIIDCQTKAINLFGGANSAAKDILYIPNYPDCNYTEAVSVLVHDNTYIRSDAEFGNFFYQIMDPDYELHVESVNCIQSHHTFSLKYNVSDIQQMKANFTVDSDFCSLSTILENGKTLTYSLNQSDPCQYPKLLTQDRYELRLSPWTGVLYASFLDTEDWSQGDSVDLFRPLGLRMNMSLTVVSNTTNQVHIFARNFTDFMVSNPVMTTYMYGSPDFDTFYTISKGENDTKSMVWIHGSDDVHSFIDCTQLVRPVRKNRMAPPDFDRPRLYLPEIKIVGNNLNIEIESSPDNHPAEIILVDYLTWYRNISLTVHEIPMQIKATDLGEYQLFSLPLPIKTNLQIVDEETFEDDQEIQVLRRCPTDKVTMYHGNNLVVSNIFSNHTSLPSNEMFVMVFHDFLTPTRRRGDVVTGKPQNVHVTFATDGNLKGSDGVWLDDIYIPALPDVLGELLEEKDRVESNVFGFLCQTAGFFQHPRRCHVYYECRVVGFNEFIQYEFTCPSGTVYCPGIQRCYYESYCPCYA